MRRSWLASQNWVNFGYTLTCVSRVILCIEALRRPPLTPPPPPTRPHLQRRLLQPSVWPHQGRGVSCGKHEALSAAGNQTTFQAASPTLPKTSSAAVALAPPRLRPCLHRQPPWPFTQPHPRKGQPSASVPSTRPQRLPFPPAQRPHPQRHSLRAVREFSSMKATSMKLS